MPKEIERKFLILSDEWKTQVRGQVELRDGLVATSGGRKVRIRTYDDRATITVKGARQGVSRDEFEYPIPLADALEMLEHHCEGRIIQKTRYYVQEEDFVFEINVYHGVLAGIVIAEAELTAIESDFPRPKWLGEEVTGQEKYRRIKRLQERLAQPEQS
jgi:CYTH domain-containing protein